jgi:tetraacyldisaccharide 4'-kinase
MFGRAPNARRHRVERWWRDGPRWYEFPLWLALAPLAAALRVAVALRRYFWRIFARRGRIPVISIGGLTVGGSGKTPVALFVATRLKARGSAVGIVSRGYRRRGVRAHEGLVSDGTMTRADPDYCGDEPAMMARSFAGPIAVAKRRRRAIDLLRRRGGLDAVVLDDGFQHLRLRRDVDLVVINEDAGLGNGWMLPAGPMREPLSAIRRADAVVLLSSGGESRLSARQLRRIERRRVIRGVLRPRALVHSTHGRWREAPLALAGRRAVVVSGLANPTGFYAMLRKLDADLVAVLEFPDHHDYSNADWQAIVTAAREADLVVTTEKDLVKLERFPFARDSLYALRLEIGMSDADLAALDRLILGRIGAPRMAASA